MSHKVDHPSHHVPQKVYKGISTAWDTLGPMITKHC